MIGRASQLFFANFLSGYLTIMAVVLITTGLIVLLRRIGLRISGDLAEGEIIGHEERMRTRVGQMRTYVPIVRFVAGGIVHQFQSVTGGTRSALPVGSRVTVRYLPSRPRRAEIDQSIHIWIAPASLLGLGIACLVAAINASK